MNIEELKIRNFRNIGPETVFNLNPNFTVIIGINGKGKSTLLHAIRVACGAYFLAIPEVKKRHVSPNEIRVIDLGKQLTQQKPVKVEAKGYFPAHSNPISWSRQILENSNTTTSNEREIGQIRRIGREKYERVTQQGDDKVDLPVIAFFGTSRAHGAGRNRVSRIGRQIFKEGYQDWYEMKSTTFKYENWLASYEVLLKSNKEYPNTHRAFFEAIKTANPYITEIESVAGKLWLKVKIDNYESDLLPIELHSDGICFFTEMVAELAYRCIILNGYQDDKAISNSKGIVMIDEIDLHLHPNWQRHVVNDLKAAFPEIQFVVTTHSPFIVQSLKSDEIWNLDKRMDVTPDELKIDSVATEIMGVSSPYSESNEKLYIKSKNFMDKLENDKSVHELERDLEDISNPAVRAFLELKKMSKGK